MTNPQRYLLRMCLFLVVIIGIGASLYQTLYFAFMSNMVINSIILTALVIGVIFIIRQNLRLIPEFQWMMSFQQLGQQSGQQAGQPSSSKTMSRRRASSIKPRLLATVAVLMNDPNGAASLSAQNLRSVLDGVAVRLDESREISRYMIGLLVFLGLLGTFWGLLITVSSVGQVVSGIDTTTSNFDAMMVELKSGLNAPISGMATAFSSSLFGLAGSLIIGFLDLQLGQASGRFFNDVEDWLSKSIHFDMAQDKGFRATSSPEFITGLSEAAANKMQELARTVAAGEKERAELSHHLRQLTATLTKLHDGLSRDALMAENIANLEASLQNLAREMKEDRAEMNDTIKMELRALSEALLAANKKG